MFEITPTTRLRRSPYFEATVKAGVKGFSPYNQMLMPTGYGDGEAEYWRLIQGVALWDVAVERQVEITGPDAGRLAQILSPRDLSKCVVSQGKYAISIAVPTAFIVVHVKLAGIVTRSGW